MEICFTNCCKEQCTPLLNLFLCIFVNIIPYSMKAPEYSPMISKSFQIPRDTIRTRSGLPEEETFSIS